MSRILKFVITYKFLCFMINLSPRYVTKSESVEHSYSGNMIRYLHLHSFSLIHSARGRDAIPETGSLCTVLTRQKTLLYIIDKNCDLNIKLKQMFIYFLIWLYIRILVAIMYLRNSKHDELPMGVLRKTKNIVSTALSRRNNVNTNKRFPFH